jgi:transcriptional regulator with XRE-family HTH domain
MSVDTNHEREALRKRLLNKKNREAFVSASVDQTIPFQIRALRLSEERNWTQKELATRAGMKQERISVCENPNYGKFSLQTLKQLASAFDVALIVRFAPFSELVEWESNLSPESLNVKNFDKEKDYFKEKEESEFASSILKEYYSSRVIEQKSSESVGLRNLIDFHQKKKEKYSAIKELVWSKQEESKARELA